MADAIVDIERHSEGSTYDTSSIFHPITMDIRERLAKPAIWCPDPMNGEGDFLEVAVECMGAIGKQAVRSALSELDSCFGDEPPTLVEAKAQYRDPRLKRMERYTQRDVQTGRPAVCERARAAIKRGIVTMIEFDRAAERARLMRAPVAAAATPAPAAAPAPAVGGKRKKPSLGNSKPLAVGALAAAASPALTFGERRPEEIAEDELLWWDELNDLTEDLLNLMPTAEHPHVLHLAHYHLEHMHRKKGPAYFHRASLAALGKNASAAETERYFRAVAFVNSLGRQRQAPRTIARLAFLQQNRRDLPSAIAMVAEYKKRAKEKRAAALRAKEAARVARNAAASAAGSEAMAVGMVEVVDAESGVSGESWERMLAGLDAAEVGDWVDGEFAAAVSTTGEGGGDVVVL